MTQRVCATVFVDLWRTSAAAMSAYFSDVRFARLLCDRKFLLIDGGAKGGIRKVRMRTQTLIAPEAAATMRDDLRCPRMTHALTSP
ncbi:MAG: hypothetical protein ABL986_23280 [Vicinamibacterales bacterium]